MMSHTECEPCRAGPLKEQREGPVCIITVIISDENHLVRQFCTHTQNFSKTLIVAGLKTESDR